MNRMALLPVAAVAAACLALACSSSSTGDDVDDDDTDRIAPATITDLHTISVTTSTVTLGWTAPGDDSMTGYAYAYDFRGSLDSITEANFASAIQAEDIFTPGPAGSTQVYAIDDLDPDMTYFFALKTRDDAGNFSPLSNCCRATCPAEVSITFPDTVLERIVREHMHRPTGDIVSSDVDTITEINANDERISDLTGIEHFTSLVFLHLINNDVTDISPLAGLTKLWALTLGGNEISDISPLAGLTGLAQLSLSENPITDLTPLAGLTNLTNLSLDAVPATDFSVIGSMTKLELLRARYDNLTDISFLSGPHPSLKALLLHNNNITDLSPLTGLAALEELQLQVNLSLSDLTPLQNLVNLNYVILSICDITDIQPLINNTGLGAGDLVDLTMNPLPDGAASTQLAALRAKGVDVRF